MRSILRLFRKIIPNKPLKPNQDRKDLREMRQEVENLRRQNRMYRSAIGDLIHYTGVSISLGDIPSHLGKIDAMALSQIGLLLRGIPSHTAIEFEIASSVEDLTEHNLIDVAGFMIYSGACFDDAICKLKSLGLAKRVTHE